MPENLDTVASNIIQESIKSAVFIDDKVLLPFEAKTSADIEDHSDLLSLFREKGCSLTYYRPNGNEWNSHEAFLFGNRDLLILDWELSNTKPGYKESLSILEKAVITKHLHFCVVYTETPKEQFIKEIIIPILKHFSFYSKIKNEDLVKLNDEFIEFCLENGIEPDEVAKEIFPGIQEIILYSSDQEKSRVLKKDLNQKISDYLNRSAHAFRKFLAAKSNGDLFGSLISLFYAYADDGIPQIKEELKVRVAVVDTTWRLYINNTIILFGNKADIKNSTGLYGEISNSLIKEHNIFLTLLGLEMRNGFRRSSGFIGKELDNIDETAFFYHHDTIEPRESFYEFLREIWIDQATSFLYEKTPLLYDHLPEYMERNAVKDKVKIFSKNLTTETKLQQYLGKLNNFYNQLKILRKENDQIRFGDIFSFKLGETTNYLLCITPHCDCLASEKIKNQFFFVQNEGDLPGLLTALQNAEKWYCSFIKEIDGSVFCIDWGEAKPFTLHLPDTKLSSLKGIKFVGQTIDLEFVGCLKENFTQRIANKAFNYPLRVGVSLAKING